MTDSSQSPATAERKKTGTLGRSDLEQALNRALAAGPIAIGQQVRYILAFSQMLGAAPTTTPHPEKPLSVGHARLVALANLSEILSEGQIKALIKEARQIADPEVKLQLLVRLALRSTPQNYRSLVRDLWNTARTLPDPAARARLIFQLAPLLSLMDDEPSAPTELLQVVALAQSINSTEARVRSLIALAPHLPQTIALRVLNRALEEVDQMANDAMRRSSLASLADPLPDEIKERALRSAQAIETPGERAQALTTLARQLPSEMQRRLRSEALDAIDTISSEEERADALIAFAPHLEYATEQDQFPALLEKALSIAIGMSRRHLRAKVLVALAPNLTLDLQGEALAAVHSLSNERDRATLLAGLAPYLPPEMLVASLAVAHTMREQDARVHALTTLAHYVPENARQQTLLDALAAAVNLPNHFERVTALIALVDILPPTLREQAYTNALETTRLMENENTRTRALNLLGPHLPPTLLKRALDAAYQLDDPQQRLNALSGMVPYLADEERIDALKHLLECANNMPLEYKRTRALVSIAPLLPADLLHESQALVDALDDPYDRVSAYIALAQNLSPEQRPGLIAKAWTRIKDIDDGYDHASALAAISPYLPPAARSDLARAAGMVIGSIMDEYDQASAISILAPLLAEGDTTAAVPAPDYYAALKDGFTAALSVPQQSLRVLALQEGIARWIDITDQDHSYQLWREVAHQLKMLPLPDVLTCLSILMPVIHTLAGDEGLESIAQILGVR